MSLDDQKVKTIGTPPRLACQTCGGELPLDPYYFRMQPFCKRDCLTEYRLQYQKEHPAITPEANK